jgi:hypothetical protein
MSLAALGDIDYTDKFYVDDKWHNVQDCEPGGDDPLTLLTQEERAALQKLLGGA